MAKQFSEEQWRSILTLSEAVADLPADARLAFLESRDPSSDVIEQVLLLVGQFQLDSVMPNRIGSSVGRFLITGHLGRGGVGDVYAATDTDLERPVALKFLGPEALEVHGAVDRLIREARTVSALNHPNIVTIHEVIRWESTVAIVMELVEGKALRECCGSPLPVGAVLQIGQQIARALAAAHAAGIIHRDIKPENVIVRPDGSLKVLDFGLAISTRVRDHGETGVSSSHLFAGTWRYMSPEQAAGTPLTAATDIYSLGMVLHELWTGEQPASAESTMDFLGVIPAGKAIRSSNVKAPAASSLDALILSMLAADPAARPSAANVTEVLERLGRPIPSRRGLGLAAVCAFIFLGAGVTFLVLRSSWTSSRPSAPLVPRAISVEAGTKSPPSFSPDGKHIVYAWKKQSENSARIYVQHLDSDEGASQPFRLTRSETPENSPVWSPDGKTIAFLRGDLSARASVFVVDSSGNHQRLVTDLLGPFLVGSRSLEWTPDSKWLFTSERINGYRSIALVSIETGQKTLLMPNAVMANDTSPSISADGKTLAFIRFNVMGNGAAQIVELPLDRHYLASDAAVVMNWPGFNTTSVRDPIWVGNSPDLLFAADPDGIARFWRSRNGKQPELVGELGEAVSDPVISRTGHRLAFLRNLEDTNVWRLDLSLGSPKGRGLSTQIISSSRMDQRPAPSPDGSMLAFESNRGGFTEIWMADLRNGKTWPLTHLRSHAGSPRWSHDGKWIVFDASANICKIPWSGGDPIRLTSAKATNMLPVWSADDKSIFFTSDRSGTSRIWRIPANGGDPTAVTPGPGTVPELTADGEFLYYQIKNYQESELWRLSLRSGKEVLIAHDVSFRTVAVGKKAVYFVTPTNSVNFSLRSLSPDTNRITAVTTLPNELVGGITISPDDRFLYYAQLDHSGNELMLVDGFH